MKILLAFDSFKNCMTAEDACRAAADGLLKALPDAHIVALPLSDGGEGMVQCVARQHEVEWVEVPVHGPLMEEITARYAISDTGIAFMEMAAASGLELVPESLRNPLKTTTFGVGEMLLDAARRGCTKIILGIGGSATCDAGEGMISCLEAHGVFDQKPKVTIPPVVIAADVDNPLYGPNGAACVFAPQKGASPADVLILEERLRRFAEDTVLRGQASPELALAPGAGAAGGLGYGLMAYLKATMHAGIDILLDLVDFDEHLRHADLVITGEGASDRQTLMGKVPFGVLSRVHQTVPVHIFSGKVEDEDALLAAGFASVRSINAGDPRPLSLLLHRDIAMHNLSSSLSAFACSKQASGS